MYALVEVDCTDGLTVTEDDDGLRYSGSTPYQAVVLPSEDDDPDDLTPPTFQELDRAVSFGVQFLGAVGGGVLLVPLQAHADAGA